MKLIGNFLEFTKAFNTETKCRKHLANTYWSKGITCPDCKGEKIYHYADKKQLKCAHCLRVFNLYTNTIFEGTKLPLVKWFLGIYWVAGTKKGISSMELSRRLGITQKTAWHMVHKIREAMKDKSNELLKGEIEIDETYVGGRRANKHKKVRYELLKLGTGYIEKMPVFGMMERGGRVIAFHVPKAEGVVLKPLIRKQIQSGATLLTDGFGGYTGLNKDYEHVVVNHQQGIFCIGKQHTNTLEGFWSLLKRGITGIYHHVSKEHLDRYCTEFAFRYNTRKDTDYGRFETILSGTDCRIKNRELTA